MSQFAFRPRSPGDIGHGKHITVYLRVISSSVVQKWKVIILLDEVNRTIKVKHKDKFAIEYSVGVKEIKSQDGP